MRKLYNIEFTQDYKGFKKGQITNEFSRDLCYIIVGTLKVAKYVSEAKTVKKVKKTKSKTK